MDIGMGMGAVHVNLELLLGRIFANAENVLRIVKNVKLSIHAQYVNQALKEILMVYAPKYVEMELLYIQNVMMGTLILGMDARGLVN